MSAIHRIDDSLSYPDSARWFQRAERLAAYPGAVRAMVTVTGMEQQAPPPAPVKRELPWVRGPLADNFGVIASYAAIRPDDDEVTE